MMRLRTSGVRVSVMTRRDRSLRGTTASTGTFDGPMSSPPSESTDRLPLAFEQRPIVVDLFSGAGGLSLGCEQAGMDVVASVEYDPICAAVHQYNFPRTEVICSDAATVTARAVRAAVREGWSAHGREGEWNGVVDVVVGGPPCQGFSVIGKRAFDDPRNQLVFAFARLVGTLKPRYFLMENVPGIGSVRAGETSAAPRLLDLLIEEFEGFGYSVLEPQVLNALNFGVPQDRRRMILIGWRDGQTKPAYPQEQTSGRSRRGIAPSGSGGREEPLPPCPTVGHAIGDLPDLHRYPRSLTDDVIELSESDRESLLEAAHPYARVMLGLDADPSDLSYPRPTDIASVTSSLRTVHAPQVAERYARTPPGRPEPVSRFFRLHCEGVSPTLRAGTHYERGSFNAPRPIHPVHPRVISVREAARLHSFPDWFRFHWTKWHGFREVGNSLPPRLARAVAAQIVSALAVEPSRPSRIAELGDANLLYLENLSAAKEFGADLTRIPRNGLRTRESASAAA
jgi:DNA (cytosine-5)-methyltransferase 1